MASVFKNKVIPFIKSIEAADIGIILLFLVFPFVFHNGYRDMTITKSYTFTAISFFSFAICCIAYCFVYMKSKKNHTPFLKAREFNISNYLMLGFFVVAILSCMCSDFQKNCLTGENGRYMGLLFFAALFFAYTFISKFYTLKNRELYLFAFASVLICVFALIQSFGINLFGLYSGYKNEQVEQSVRNDFLSPFGNRDTLAGYLAFAFPLISALYCFSNNRKKANILLIVSILLSFMCAIISNCDLVYLGIVAGLWVICLISLGNIERLRHFSTVCVIICCAFIVCFALFRLHLIDRKVSGSANKILVSWFAIIPMTVIFGAIHILLHRFTPKPELLKKTKIAYICISAFALIGIVLIAVYFTFINKTADIGDLSEIFRCDDKWGNSRGRIWRLFSTAYARLPLSQKLFGGGLDCARSILSKHCMKEILIIKSLPSDNAHNEFLQHLLFTGIAGVAFYISLIVTSIRRLLKNKENALSYVVLVAIIAYLAQSTVNVTQPLTTPFIFIFLAFCNCLVPHEMISPKKEEE